MIFQLSYMYKTCVIVNETQICKEGNNAIHTSKSLSQYTGYHLVNKHG